MHQKISN